MSGIVKENKTILVTGAAGFIGYHLSEKLLKNGWKVIGLDCFSDYYSVSLKKDREMKLLAYNNYVSVRARLEEKNVLEQIFQDENPSFVVHLAAQAGVRHSIEHPRQFLNSNITGTFELLESARRFPPKHMLLASTSSAYGENVNLPYKEIMKTDHPISFYAATKKTIEVIAHSYSHLFSLPITMFRFFTVYGSWGRPDMAYFKFTKNILSGQPIKVYNNGNMERDFTYVDDLVKAIYLLLDVVPKKVTSKNLSVDDTLSPVAPYRIVNVGNSKPIKLIELIECIEKETGVLAKKEFMPMQVGDVMNTWADTTLLKVLTGFQPQTDIKVGIKGFVNWYFEYYRN